MESGKSYYPPNPVGPSGAPRAPRGHHSFAGAHVENPWENKGFVRSLEVPVCYVREGIRGGRLPGTADQIPFKNISKTSISGKTRYPTNTMGPNGAPSVLRGTQSPAKAHVDNPWEKVQMILRFGIRMPSRPDSNGFVG